MRTLKEIQPDVEKATTLNKPDELARLIEELDAQGTPEATAFSLASKGWLATMHGKDKEALEFFERSLRQHEELGHRYMVASLVQSIGISHKSLGDFPSALEYYQRALDKYEELDFDKGIARSMMNISNIYFYACDYSSALEQYQKVLDHFKESGEQNHVANVIGNMGSVYTETGDYEAAINHFQRALNVHEELGDQAGVGTCYGGIGKVLALKEEFSQAIEIFNKSLDAYKSVSFNAGVLDISNNMVTALLNLNRLEEAQSLIDSMDESDLSNPSVHVLHLRNAGKALVLREDVDAALKKYNEALEFAKRLQLKNQEADTHRDLRDLALKSNDLPSYVTHNDAFAQLSEEIRGKETARKIAMQSKQREIDAERKESEKQRAVLYSTLPKDIADRVVRGDDVSGDEYDHASVLFLDVVGFTANSHELGPRVVTQLLDEVFDTFDNLCEEYNVTKVKTIGDAYLAVAFPIDTDQVSITEHRLASVALAIQETTFNWPNGSPLQFRIGLHSGPVVAGVIGKQRLQYDVWGDTVNVASRMESSGAPGKIHVSEAFAAVIPSGVRERGPIEVKGKGLMTTYWLEPR